MAMNIETSNFRTEAKASDVQDIKDILESSGFFYSFEIDVAIELIEDRLEKGEKSDYSFLFYEKDGKLVAYTCFSLIPCTISSFDIYWIAVHNDYRGHGLGKSIMAKTEEIIQKMGGKKMYIETSGREQYKPTRLFYEACGYKPEATLKDFYDLGDDKIIEVKDVMVVS